LEYLGQGTFQALHDWLQPRQGDALLADLQPIRRGGRKADLSRKFGVGQVAAPLAQKPGQLSFELARHARTLPKMSFRMWNIFGFEIGKEI
jgi:hypothetical protein